MKNFLMMVAVVLFSSPVFAGNVPAEMPKECQSAAIENLAEDRYIAHFPAMIWFDGEPYIKAGEYGGFTAIGGFAPNFIGVEAPNGGLAVVAKTTKDGEDFYWRVEYYMPYQGECRWFAGALLEYGHKSLEPKNALGQSPFAEVEALAAMKDSWK